MQKSHASSRPETRNPQPKPHARNTCKRQSTKLLPLLNPGCLSTLHLKHESRDPNSETRTMKTCKPQTAKPPVWGGEVG